MKLSLLVAILLFPIQSFAGGSFSPESELAPILAEVPQMRDFVEDTLELAASGSANRIGNTVNPRLGGRRVGPYRILAKAKGSPGPFTFELLFHTELVLVDEQGEVAALPDAHAIREHLKSLEMRPVAPK